jgi:TRAP-type C4-dicarboxylate transport system permease small subunit
MWLGVILVVLVLFFFVRLGLAVLTAYDRAAAAGTSVPDMSGGIAAILTALACLIPALAQIFPIFQNYHRERMDQQARGIPPSGIPFPGPPMAQPPLPESGTSLNPHGGPGAP